MVIMYILVLIKRGFKMDQQILVYKKNFAKAFTTYEFKKQKELVQAFQIFNLVIDKLEESMEENKKLKDQLNSKDKLIISSEKLIDENAKLIIDNLFKDGTN